MTVDRILEREKNYLLDYLFTLSEPRQFLSEEIDNLFPGSMDNQDIRFILQNNYINSWFNGSPASSSDHAWIDISEIEIPADEIEPDEIEDFTVIGDYAYYYVGYGLSVEFDINGIKSDVAELL